MSDGLEDVVLLGNSALRNATIHLVMDNLNLHGRAAVIGVLVLQQGAALWARFTPTTRPSTAAG